MDKLKVIITNDQKAVKIPAGLRLMLRRCCTAVLRMEHFQGDAEVNITFTDDEKIREMNNQFRHIDAATDVLSLAMTSSVNEFHSPHEGQRPNHFGASKPQFLQKNAFFTFAIALSDLQTQLLVY